MVKSYQPRVAGQIIPLEHVSQNLVTESLLASRKVHQSQGRLPGQTSLLFLVTCERFLGTKIACQIRVWQGALKILYPPLLMPIALQTTSREPSQLTF